MILCRRNKIFRVNFVGCRHIRRQARQVVVLPFAIHRVVAPMPSLRSVCSLQSMGKTKAAMKSHDTVCDSVPLVACTGVFAHVTGNISTLPVPALESRVHVHPAFTHLASAHQIFIVSRVFTCCTLLSADKAGSDCLLCFVAGFQAYSPTSPVRIPSPPCEAIACCRVITYLLTPLR